MKRPLRGSHGAAFFYRKEYSGIYMAGVVGLFT
jgi:hypothetical protein